jgi:glycine/D-amino acid oxidase-like deaminating enzyme
VIPGFKWDPDELVAKFGEDAGERLVTFAGSAPDLVFDLITRHDIQCAASREGWLQAVHTKKLVKAVELRAAQWQARGAPVNFVRVDEAYALTGSPAYVAALVEPRGGKLNPLSYARGLARAAASAGATISPNSPVTGLQQTGGNWVASTPTASIAADKVLLATNGYTDGLWPKLRQTLIPVASFIVATRPLSDNVRRTILPGGHVISDTRRLLTYSRLDEAGRLVVGARGKWQDPIARSDFDHVVRQLHQLFPQVGDIGEAEFFWSERVAITPDYLPHVHEPAPGLLIVLGYNGRGIAMATAMGAAAGKYAVNGDRQELPLPSSGISPIPMHGVRRGYVAAMSAWYRMLDGLGL